MKEGYRLLGDFIRQVDVRNTDGKEENLFGVSVQKMFIPSIANTIGTDFTKYKVVKRGQFTYIPDTSRRGDKIGIALLMDYDEGLVSNIYTVFEVKDENELLPEYLMLWFSRPEFDRYARFKSHGSVREIMDWDEMCKVELPVPSIDKQRSIVKAYQTITERIEHVESAWIPWSDLAATRITSSNSMIAIQHEALRRLIARNSDKDKPSLFS